MAEGAIHPGLVLIAGALALPWLRGAVRTAAVVLLPLAALALVWQVPDGAAWQIRYLDYTLAPLQGDRLARLFATVFALMAAGGGLYALTQPSRVEIPAAFVYAGSAIGVAMAGDLVSVFVCWELMAVGSTLVIWSQGSGRAYRAARRYLMIHLLGGVILFAGITGHIAATGSVAFDRMAADSPAHWLMLCGFLINAAAPPLTAWLPDAYPEASWSGMVFLSAFTTKTAVYVLMRGFAGTELLIWLGLFMVVYAIVYAAVEIDMRRLLAYAIVNHVGFMVAAVGIGTEMALNGAAAYAFTHILYKALLLMSAGAVLRATGERRCSELGGLYRTMPLTAAAAVVGALSSASFPLTAGFVSKSLILQAAADDHLVAVWLVLMAASAAVVLHAGLKFPWLVFFGRGRGLQAADPPASMRIAMGAFMLLCLVPGIWSEPLYRLLPYPTTYQPYTAAHVLTQLQLLLFASLAFFVMLPYMRPRLTSLLDTDWVWRRLLPALAAVGERLIVATWSGLGRAVRRAGLRLLTSVIRHHGPEGHLARTWPTGSMALWVLVLLLGYLVLYYV